MRSRPNKRVLALPSHLLIAPLGKEFTQLLKVIISVKANLKTPASESIVRITPSMPDHSRSNRAACYNHCATTPIKAHCLGSSRFPCNVCFAVSLRRIKCLKLIHPNGLSYFSP
jgi:hypothetical protein